MNLFLLAPLILSAAARVHDCPRPEQILQVQQHEAMVRRAQRREVAPPRVAEAPVDHRTPEQRAADNALLAEFMKHEPTGKLIPVTFADGKVWYVPEVK